VKTIAALRRLRMTAAENAEGLGLALSTVSLLLKRIGLGKRSALAPPEPPNRYERKCPGELIHVDVKKLGRFGVAGKRAITKRRSSRGYGLECCHVSVDDATRLAYVEVLPDERGETAVAFLRRALEWFAERGVKVQRVMTNNGSPYVSAVHASACRKLGIKHLRTQPYRPRTHDKAERSTERCAALGGWLDRSNYRRKHGSPDHRPPTVRLSESLGNNLVGNYS
jgi:transposase InsO family protein